MGHFEVSVGTGTLGVNHTLRDSLPVEMSEEVDVVLRWFRSSGDERRSIIKVDKARSSDIRSPGGEGDRSFQSSATRMAQGKELRWRWCRGRHPAYKTQDERSANTSMIAQEGLGTYRRVGNLGGRHFCRCVKGANKAMNRVCSCSGTNEVQSASGYIYVCGARGGLSMRVMVIDVAPRS